MLIHVRGLKIHAKSRDGGVVHLVVSTKDENRSTLGRLRQYVANALFRAGDFCHPSNNNGPLRVVTSKVRTNPADDLLANGRDDNIVEVRPLHLTHGDTYYNAFLTHESVKSHEQRGLLAVWHRIWRQKSANDVHFVPLSQTLFGKQFTGKVEIDPDQP